MRSGSPQNLSIQTARDLVSATIRELDYDVTKGRREVGRLNFAALGRYFYKVALKSGITQIFAFQYGISKTKRSRQRQERFFRIGE